MKPEGFVRVSEYRNRENKQFRQAIWTYEQAQTKCKFCQEFVYLCYSEAVYLLSLELGQQVSMYELTIFKTS